jgi:hypothetical protein
LLIFTFQQDIEFVLLGLLLLLPQKSETLTRQRAQMPRGMPP